MEKSPLIREQVLEKLRNHINEMRADTHIRIPSERSLSESLGVSRISIRAAVKTLVKEGVLIQAQGKGTYITPTIGISSLHIICSPELKQNDPFYNNFLVHITQVAARQSISLTMLDIDRLDEDAQNNPLIIVGLLDKKIITKLKKSYKRIISVQDYPNENSIFQIYFDDYHIGLSAAKYFTEKGFRHMLHLAGPEKFPSAVKRKRGFYDGTLENKSNEYMEINCKMNWKGGYEAGEEVAEKYRKSNKPFAVFAANDWMAIGLIQKLKELNINVPLEISVIGCDNIPLAADFSPALSTFGWDTGLLISEMLSVLNKPEDYGDNTTKKIVLPAKFISRESITIKKIADMKG